MFTVNLSTALTHLYKYVAIFVVPKKLLFTVNLSTALTLSLSTDPNTSLPLRQARYDSPPDTTILLDDLVCAGDEDTLLDCRRASKSGVVRDVGESDCGHFEDAGVVCDGE